MHTSLRSPSIAIVGAGIGGLVLSLSLRARGIKAEVFEQSAELSEIGGAVALSANATRELERLGLLEALAALSTEPEELIWRDGRMAGFPDGFGWIHAHDALAAAEGAKTG